MSNRQTLLGRRALTAAGLVAAVTACSPAPTYDVVIRGGTVFDGTDGPGVVADVGIEDGHIRRVGDLSDQAGAEEVDATGLYVTPGFINLHSHDRLDALPTSANLLSQGVTTILLNADGGGPLDITAQLDGAARSGLPINIGAHIGFNRAWGEINGPRDERPTAERIAAMQMVIRDGLRNGAWGVSAGLDYKPAYFSTTDEVVEVLAGLEAYRTVFTNHDRLTPESGFSSTEGMRETIEIGEATGLVPVMTHMKIQGREQGSADAVLAMMDSATQRGVFTAADAYPYLAGMTGLGALLVPGWAQEGGVDAMLSRFEDPALRPRIVAEANEAMAARFGGPEGVFLPDTQRELTDVMREFGVEDGGEAVLRLLSEQASRPVILRFGAEEDLAAILSYRATSISCDCDPAEGAAGHPRNYGTYPRALGRYVRELGVLSWEGAIHRMTAVPAETVGMIDRGYLTPGMAADVVVFDPETVIDHATYLDPAEHSEGIREVWVNGVRAVSAGEVVPSAGGQPLRRALFMPARPVSGGRGARLALRATRSVDGVEGTLEVDLTQSAGSAAAVGTLREVSEDGSIVWEVGAFGHLQTAEGWTSVTGTVQGPAGEAAVTVVVDSAYPGLAADRTLVLVVVEGAEPVRLDVPSGSVERGR